MATYNIPHDVTCSSDAQENLRCSECGLTVRDAMRSTRKGNRYCRLCVTGRTDDEEADKELLVLSEENGSLREELYAVKADNQELRKKNEILQKQLNEMKERYKEIPKPGNLLPILSRFPSLAEGRYGPTDTTFLHLEVEPVMETSGSAEDDDERMKQLEERVLNATKKEEENSEKLNDLDAESECCERRLAKMSLATGGGDLMGVKRDKFHSNGITQSELQSFQETPAEPD